MASQKSIRNAMLAWVVIVFAVLFQAGCGVQSGADSDLQRLQGRWESEGASGKTSITITDNKLHFYQRPDFWFETSFVLATDRSPRQLHATIENSAKPGNDIGEVVIAIYEVEEGRFTLATDGGGGLPANFAEAESLYELEKAPPGEKH